jgi:hypothetical protein
MVLINNLLEEAFRMNSDLEAGVIETLRLSLLTTLEAMAESLPLFLSPYLSGFFSALVKPVPFQTQVIDVHCLNSGDTHFLSSLARD